MLIHLSLILASKSPRRQELMSLMGLNFRVVLKEVDESYPEHLSPEEVAVYISEKKAKAFDAELGEEVVITADTIVAVGKEILGKPADEADAFRMLNLLSGKTHQVITGVSVLHRHTLYSFYDVTEVAVNTLTEEEIRYYIETCKPFDKAGAYGIQEWFGLAAIKSISGSYTNVVGLPTERLYQALKAL